MSFHTKGHKFRPLGATRQSVSHFDSVSRFPPVRGARDKSYEGIHGNALVMFPQRQTLDRLEQVERVRASDRQRTVNVPSDTDSNIGSKMESEKNKLLQEALVREKHLEQQLQQLQAIIDELRIQLREKEITLADLKDQFCRQEEHYQDLLEKEREKHAETRAELNDTTNILQTTVENSEKMKLKYEGEIKELHLALSSQVAELKTEMEKEIAVRDEKLKRLKQHMADALQGNSWERQQQLDELTKELKKSQEDVDLLKMKLKVSQKSSKTCANCDVLTLQLNKFQNGLVERDQVINQLKTSFSKMEKEFKRQTQFSKTISRR